MTEGESINKFSIPYFDCTLLSDDFGALFFSSADFVSAAAG